MTKAERLQIFLERWAAAEPACNVQEALDCLSKLLNEVEDEFSNIPPNPEKWREDGRMYPPQADSEKKAHPDFPGWRRFRNAGHNTLFAPDGAIRIYTTEDNRCIFCKPGAP